MLMLPFLLTLVCIGYRPSRNAHLLWQAFHRVLLVPQEEVPFVVLSDNNLGIKLIAQAQVPKQIMPVIHTLFTLYSHSPGFDDLVQWLPRSFCTQICN